MIELHCGDCLEVMRDMETGSVDFAFTDPPYNVGKDYGDYKDNLSDDEYLLWTMNVLTEIKRVARTACIYVPQKYISQYWHILGSGYRQIVLTYTPEGAIRWGFINQFSSLLTNAVPTMRTKNVWHNCQMTGLGWFFRENTYGHPGYTSEDITGRVIQKFTQPGWKILDPFMGTGTTGKECVKYGRNFIGIERETHWFELSKRRIHEAQMQPSLLEDL